MPPEPIRSSILNGQKALVVGVANDRSIAWGCAQAMQQAGAEIAMTYLNSRALPYVGPLAKAVGAQLLLPLEVRDTAQVMSYLRRSRQNGDGSTFSCIRSRLRRAKRWRAASPIARVTAS